MQPFPSQNRILAVLSDGKARSTRDVASLTGLSKGATENALRRLWERRLIMRTKSPMFEAEKVFRGRAGVKRNAKKQR